MKRAWLLLLLAFAAIPLLPRPAVAYIPTVSYSITTAAPAVMPIIYQTGQSTCSFTYVSNGGSSVVTPYASADGTHFFTPPSIGVQSADGSYGGGVVPGIYAFYVDVNVVDGEVTVTETCTSAVAAEAPAPTATPTAVPTFSPTPTPTPVPTPPTPAPTATPANCPTAIASLKPLAYYKLDEAPSAPPASPADSSGNSYTGTIHNAGSVQQGQLPLTALAPAGDYAYGFANPGYVSMPTTLPYGAKFSLVALVSPALNAAFPPYLCFIDYHGQCLALTTGFLGWGQTTSQGNVIASKAVALSNATHLITLVEDTTTTPATVQVAVDGGTLVNANPGGATALPPVAYSYLRTWIKNTIVTYQDESAILPYKLSQTQVTQLAVPCAPAAAPTPTPSPTPIPPGNYPAAILAYHPIGYYRLDDPSGTTAVDSSGYGRDADQVNSGSITLGATGLLVGDSDTAYSFTAANGFASNTTLPFYQNVTFTLLLKGSTIATGTNWLLSYHTNTYIGVLGGKLAFHNGGVPGATFISSQTIANNTAYWIAVVCVKSTVLCSYSVNGGTLTKFCTNGSCGVEGAVNNIFEINGARGLANGCVCTLDEVAILPSILTQAQVTAMAATAGYP